MCPGGDNIVAALGSEMTKNGNIAFESSRSQPVGGQIAQLRSQTYSISRGPWWIKPLVSIALAIPL
jgi:hypothetical protein